MVSLVSTMVHFSCIMYAQLRSIGIEKAVSVPLQGRVQLSSSGEVAVEGVSLDEAVVPIELGFGTELRRVTLRLRELNE